MSRDVTHIGKANRRRLEKAKGQLESALKLVDSVLDGKPHWPSANITNAWRHSRDAKDYLYEVLGSAEAGLTEKQKHENPEVL